MIREHLLLIADRAAVGAPDVEPVRRQPAIQAPPARLGQARRDPPADQPGGAEQGDRRGPVQGLPSQVRTFGQWYSHQGNSNKIEHKLDFLLYFVPFLELHGVIA